jgi:hypothetical protein
MWTVKTRLRKPSEGEAYGQAGILQINMFVFKTVTDVILTMAVAH